MAFLTLLMVVSLVPFGILAVILGDGHPPPVPAVVRRPIALTSRVR